MATAISAPDDQAAAFEPGDELGHGAGPPLAAGEVPEPVRSLVPEYASTMNAENYRESRKTSLLTPVR